MRFRKHDETDWDGEEPPPPPPVDYRSARVVHGEFCAQVEAYAASELGVTFYDLPEG